VVVEAGQGFRLGDGRLVIVEAEAERLLEARGDLARLAWHVGNRHAPCELGEGWLRVPFDRPMEAMLRGLGAEVVEVTAPFRPEGGAYEGAGHGHDGHGAGHDHGAGLGSLAPGGEPGG
jgi:urease accessory protein